MNWIDWLIIAAITAAVILALRRIRRNRKTGCSCGCAECGRPCAKQKGREEAK